MWPHQKLLLRCASQDSVKPLQYSALSHRGPTGRSVVYWVTSLSGEAGSQTKVWGLASKGGLLVCRRDVIVRAVPSSSSQWRLVVAGLGMCLLASSATATRELNLLVVPWTPAASLTASDFRRSKASAAAWATWHSLMGAVWHGFRPHHFISAPNNICIVMTAAPNRPCRVMGMSRRLSSSLFVTRLSPAEQSEQTHGPAQGLNLHF